MKREENDRVYMFLAGVNRSLDEVKGRILGRKPLPSIREVFFEVRQEECWKRIMLGDSASSVTDHDSSALVSPNPEFEGDRRKKPWCDYCKKPWHARETYWKIHGKPPHLKKRPDGHPDGRAMQIVADNSQERKANLSTNSFAKEQLDQLYNLFQSPQFSVNSSCSLVQTGIYLTVALLV